MPPVLLQYAAADVEFLLGMKLLWAPKGEDKSEALDQVVKELTVARLKKFVDLSRDEALDQSNKKFRDFEIPDGFNETGDISQRVPVPPHMKGRVIGKGGATIKAIQASSGATVSLVDCTAVVAIAPAIGSRQ